MKQSIGMISVSALLLCTLGCSKTPNPKNTVKGSWKVAAKTVEVGSFNQVSLSGPGDLQIVFGENPRLRIEADDNLLPYLVARSTDRTLVLENPPQIRLSPRRRVKYYLTVKDLDGITALGNGNVFVPDLQSEKFSLISNPGGHFSLGVLKAEEVTINPGGDGNWYDTNHKDLEIEALYAEELKVINNSNQDVYIANGEVKRLDIQINGEGDYEAPDVATVEAEVRMKGAGSVTVRVSQRLNVRMEDFSGNVYYRGNPEITRTRQSDSSGRLIRLDK